MINLSERAYRMLLRLYPAEHQAEYGELMMQLFREMMRDARRERGTTGVLYLWGTVVGDSIQSLVTEHLDQYRRKPMSNLPAQIDRYQVKQQIATGSATHIYLAHDAQNQRDVVVKLMRPEKMVISQQHSLEHEAQIMRDLDHPFIPKVYDYAASSAHTYMVMEFLPGKDFLLLLDERDDALPERELIDWGVQLCDFLTYLHTRQPEPLVFRDMKPANIILDEQGGLHIIDFGIAVGYLPDKTYERIGTIGYSPPEQYVGKVDARSDIYALGASLYHLATRRDPRAENGAFLFHVIPPRALNPALSEAFETVILKATEHKAADRYQTAEEMKRALVACKP